MSRTNTAAGLASPGRKAGCGLKQRVGGEPCRLAQRITRPKGRVRIETVVVLALVELQLASPGRKAGCGLKLDHDALIAEALGHHPAERPGAD